MWQWICSWWGDKKDPKDPKDPNGIVASEVSSKESKRLLSKIKDKLSK
jgi:hypothetical protein